MSRWDAVVVGAGPAGSALAIRLARSGHAVLVLDRARFPREKPCSEYLSPGTVRAIDQLGLLDRVLAAHPAHLTGMRVAGPDGVVMEGRFVASHPYPAPFPFALSLPRRTLDQILRNAAGEVAEVREGMTVDELIYEGGAVAGVVARENSGTRTVFRARVVVGADGLRSLVARRLGGVNTIGPQRVALTAHVADVAGVDDWGELHVGSEGYVGLAPIGEGITTIALVLPLAAVRRRLPDLRGGARFFADLERFPGLAGRTRAATIARPVLVTGPFARWSRRPVADGALLVGDAADFFDPFTGQGIFAAVHGAALAAAALAEPLAAAGPVTAAALAAYRRARQRAFAGKWLLERAIGLGVGWPALAERVIRRLARRPRLADLVVGAAGNFVPTRAVLGPRPLLAMLW